MEAEMKSKEQDQLQTFQEVEVKQEEVFEVLEELGTDIRKVSRKVWSV